jgi:hypothetical protein
MDGDAAVIFDGLEVVARTARDHVHAKAGVDEAESEGPCVFLAAPQDGVVRLRHQQDAGIRAHSSVLRT